MKNIAYILSLAGLMAFASCQKDNFNGGAAEPGGNITFTCGTDDARSRTQYAVNDWLQIEWQLNDEVKIYSSQTKDMTGQAAKTSASYNVSKLIEREYDISTDAQNPKKIKNNNSANLTVGEGGGLFWGTGSHTLYAVHGDADVNPSTGKATFTYKTKQTCRLTAGEGEQTYIDKSQLNLVSTKTVQNPVQVMDLPFTPIMTAVEIEVKGMKSSETDAKTIKVTSVTLENTSTTTHWYGANSTDDGYVYKFDYTIGAGTFAIAGTEVSKELVTLELVDGNNDYIEVPVGGSFKVTAILPPVSISTSQLKIGVNVQGNSPVTATLNAQITKSYKALVSLPNWKPKTETQGGDSIGDKDLEDLENNVYPWQKNLPDNAYVASVTMPGTAHSGATKNSGINWTELMGNTVLVQPYSVLAQLAQGVRVLEFFPVGLGNGNYKDASDPPSNRSWEYYSDALYNAVWSNTEVTGSADSGDVKKRDNMVFRLAEWVKTYPTEFIFLFISPLNAGRYSNHNQNQNNRNYAITYWKQQNILKVFDPDMTVGDCRGNIIVCYMNDVNNALSGSNYCFIANDKGVVGNETSYNMLSLFVDPSFTPAWKNNSRYTAQFKASDKQTTLGASLNMQNYVGNETASTYTTKKPTYVRNLLDEARTNASNTNWYYNVVGGYAGIYTVPFIGTKHVRTKHHRDAAEVVQSDVVNYIQDCWDSKNGKTPGPLGMVLVDFSGSDYDATANVTLNGRKLVQMLIDNNFKDNVLRLKSGN